MSGHFDLVEVDVWPRLRPAIEAERANLVEGLTRIDAESLRYYQGRIAALDWVLQMARPVPQTPASPPVAPEEDAEDAYT